MIQLVTPTQVTTNLAFGSNGEAVHLTGGERRRGLEFAHRLVLDPQARFSGQTVQGIVEEIIKTLPVPS